MELSDIINFSTLYESLLRCQKGVLYKDSVARISLNRIEWVWKLLDKFKRGAFQSSPLYHFFVRYPKLREIGSLTQTDRIYQRAIHDEYLYPTLTSDCIDRNFACQKGKGTDVARESMKRQLQSYARHHGSEGYVVQVDISKYYPTMSHRVTEDRLKHTTDSVIFDCLKEIFQTQYPEENGYMPGSPIVQVIGVTALNKVDSFIVNELKPKVYARYMDDFVSVFQTKEEATYALSRIKEQLSAIEMIPNEKKTHIYPLSKGIPFLGFSFRIVGDNKVIMTILPSKVKDERIKLRRMIHAVRTGKISKKRAMEHYESFRKHLMKGDSYHLLLRMDQYVKQLWEEPLWLSDQRM